MNLCMVGYGAIAEKHVQAFAEMEGVRPRVLVGRRPEPTAAFAHQWGFERQTLDLASALSDSLVDAVVITSPSELHVPQATQALEAGKHVLLEIPIALNVGEAEALTELSRRADRRLMICHTMRSFPGLQEVRRRVKARALHLHHIVGFFGLPRRTNTTVHGNPRSWTDDIHWHHGAHLVDIALWTSGCRDPLEVDCRFGPQHPTQGVMDMTLAMLLPGGILVSIAQSYNISRFRWRLLFVGEEDTLEWDEGTLTNAAGEVVVPHRSIFDLREQNQEFIAAVREGRDPAITGEEVLPTMRALQTAQTRARAQRSSPPS